MNEPIMDSSSQDQEMEGATYSRNDSEDQTVTDNATLVPTSSYDQFLAVPASQISNNDPAFKYKYPEAKPTPPGEDDLNWNKVYTAADSRMYNKHGKDANNSRKFRISGETRVLAIKMLEEKKAKEAAGFPPRAAAKAKLTAAPKKPFKNETSTSSRGTTPNFETLSMSISEKIKAEGRARKASLPGPSTSNQSTPAPSSSKMGSPAPPATKIEKQHPPKKKGTAAPARKPGKKTKLDGTSISRAGQTPGPTAAGMSSDSESNDGGEYCICRGPDDHRMMVYCDGGCKDWYHCECLKIDEDDARELLDRFICPKCRTADTFTTWKRMCRCYNVDGCRKAARVTSDPPSKYCSDEHKTAFWQYVKSLVRSDGRPSMGGALNQAEVGALLKDSKGSATAFHDLGQKPRLPVKEDTDPIQQSGLNYLTPEEETEIDTLKARVRVINAQIESVKNQSKLLNMAHERAKIAAQQPNLDVKDICGYDTRMSLNEIQFQTWFHSDEGKKVFATGTLGPRTDETRAINVRVPIPGQELPDESERPDVLKNVCLNGRKRCRHLAWREIHNQDYLETTASFRKEVRKLEKQIDEIIDDAETREATKDYFADNVTIQLF